MKRLFFSTTVLFVAAHVLSQDVLADPYGSGWYGETHVAMVYHDNLSRSAWSPDVESDTVSSLGVGGGYSRKSGLNSQVTVSGYVTWNRHNDFRDLDSLALSMGASWTLQPKPGFSTVWYNFTGNVTRLDYRDSDIREGYLFSVDLSLNKRLSAETTTRVGLRHDDLVFMEKSSWEEAASAAFDTAGSEAYLGGDYRLARNTFLFAEYAFRHGEFTSNASGIPPSGWYEAESIDPVFDRCRTTQCADGYSYRVSGDTHKLDGGIVFPLASASADLSARYYDAEDDNGIGYKSWWVQLGLVWTF